MASEFLDAYIENSNFEILRRVPELEGNKCDWKNIIYLCLQFRQAAVCSLFLSDSVSDYYAYMMKSSTAFLHYCLQPPDSLLSLRLSLSASEPLLDAISGGFFDLAKKIYVECPTVWNSDYEYEEDFLYLKILMLILYAPADIESRDVAMDRYKIVSTDMDESRVNICKALFERNSDDLHAALSQLLKDRSKSIEDKIGRSSVEEEPWAWLRYYSNEGLSILRIAKKLEMKMDHDYLHIPQELLRPHTVEVNYDSWKNF